MTMNTDIETAHKVIIENWGYRGNIVLQEISSSVPFNGSFEDFLHHCTACGGNWGGMLLTGIRELWPNIWNAIPDNMGLRPFECIVSVLILCGVDCS